MNENDRRILTRACGIPFYKWDGPWFDIPDDWELVRVNVVMPNKEEYSVYLWERWHYEYETKRNASVECLSWYLSLSDEDRNQIAADFIKARPDLFPWVVEMEEVNV